MVYRLLKNGIPVAVAYTPEEADRLYAEYECDECIAYKSEENIQQH